MFLRAKRRFKDGKEHRYWSRVENRRAAGGRVVQRQVLDLGEINDAQRAAWCPSIEVFDTDVSGSQQWALLADDGPAPEWACPVVGATGLGPLVGREAAPRSQGNALAPCAEGACWSASACWHRGAHGGCTGSGSGRRSWRISWARISGWRRRIRCTAVWIVCWSTRRRFFSVWPNVGTVCSGSGSLCCCTI
jgi:hypothetical protein